MCFFASYCLEKFVVNFRGYEAYKLLTCRFFLYSGRQLKIFVSYCSDLLFVIDLGFVFFFMTYFIAPKQVELFHFTV